MSQDTLNLTVGRVQAVPVEVPFGGQSVVTVVSGGTVFWSDHQVVSSTINQGSIAVGASQTFLSSVWLIGTVPSAVQVVSSAGSTQDVVLGSDNTVGGPGGSPLTSSVVKVSSGQTAYAAYYDPSPNAGGSPNISIGGPTPAGTAPFPNIQAGAYSNQAFGGGWRGGVPQTGNLGALTTGHDNTAIGPGVLVSLTTGHSNVGVGADVLSALVSAFSNTAVGSQAVESNVTGNYVTGVGAGALIAATAGPNDAFGANAGAAITSAINCVAIGNNALLSNATTSNNTAVGNSAAANIVNVNNTAVGAFALQGANAAAANVANHVAIGYQALKGVTTANNCTVVGTNAARAITTGGANVVIGNSAAISLLLTGVNNVIVGDTAMTTGSTDSGSMVLIGASTVGTGNFAVAIGQSAKAGNGSIAIGNATQATAAGAIAIGMDHAGVSTTTAVQDQIALGTASHHLLLKTAAAPADASLAASQFTMWLDATNGAAKLMIKAKQADGTVRTGSLALA